MDVLTKSHYLTTSLQLLLKQQNNAPGVIINRPYSRKLQPVSQSVFACSKSTIKTPEQCVS